MKDNILNPLLVGFSNLIASLLGIIFWIILANMVDVKSYGEVNYHISIATLGSIISLFGLNITSITYIPKGNELIFREASYLVSITSAIAAILIILILNSFATALLLVAMSSYIMTVDESLANRRYKRYSLLTILNKGLQIILSLLLYYAIGINGIIIGHAIPSLIIGYKLYRSIKPSIGELRSKLMFTLHAYSLSLSQTISLYIDKLLIAPIFGFAILGLYQLGFQFLIFLSILPTTLLQYLLPQEAKGIKLRSLERASFILSIILAVVSYLTLPYIIESLFPNYMDGLEAFRIMIFGIIPLTANSLINASLLADEKGKFVLIGAVIYMTSFILSILTLGSALGIIGLALSMVSSLSLQAVTLYTIKRIYRNMLC